MIDALADEISPYIPLNPSPQRMELSVEKKNKQKKLVITLYLLKDTGGTSVIANAFGISASTVSNTIRSVCYAINTQLARQ